MLVLLFRLVLGNGGEIRNMHLAADVCRQDAVEEAVAGSAGEVVGWSKAGKDAGFYVRRCGRGLRRAALGFCEGGEAGGQGGKQGGEGAAVHEFSGARGLTTEV